MLVEEQWVGAGRAIWSAARAAQRLHVIRLVFLRSRKPWGFPGSAVLASTAAGALLHSCGEAQCHSSLEGVSVPFGNGSSCRRPSAEGMLERTARFTSVAGRVTSVCLQHSDTGAGVIHASCSDSRCTTTCLASMAAASAVCRGSRQVM